ncbi:MAG: Stp1/IreP family PP2C-type Ser/Thr phosphatase [Calditrichia bacterium]|nr:Stp1/IreP family PP2C-type Ser/Thr phosphatase [Calditrichota bacterium]
MLKIFGQTDVGKVRNNNEDHFLVMQTTSDGIDKLPQIFAVPTTVSPAILMVSDGMGGAAAGEVASLMAVNTVAEWFKSSENEFSDPITAIDDALQQANRNIIEYAKTHQGKYGMGATGTLAVVFGKRLVIGQVGDSRAYLIRNNAIRQLTRDQSFVNQLVEAGKITEEEAEIHPRRNIILQALGNEEKLDVVISEEELQSGDKLLLCSDGLSGMIPKNELLEIVTASSDIASTTAQLIQRANELGGIDNITVVCASWNDEPA